MVVNKKSSQLCIDPSSFDSNLKSYLLVRLSSLQDNTSKKKNRTSIKVKHNFQKSPLQQTPLVTGLGGGIAFKNHSNQHQSNSKVGSDLTNAFALNSQQKNEQNSIGQKMNGIKNIIRKRSDSRKLNAPSTVSKQVCSTRASKQQELKGNNNLENPVSTNQNLPSQNLSAPSKQELKEKSMTDIIYCDYIIEGSLIRQYKITVSQVYIDQHLLVLSLEENMQKAQKELKKQNDLLNELLVRSHIGYMQKQQIQFHNLCEVNYADLKFNQYLHMNSIFAMMQYLYQQKRSRLPIKVQEFNLNAVFDSVQQLFPQLVIAKDQNVNVDSNKWLVKSDEQRIKFILISILSSLLGSNNSLQKQSILDTPQRNRGYSAHSNHIKQVGTPYIQFLSPPMSSGRRLTEAQQSIQINNICNPQQLQIDDKFKQINKKDTSETSDLNNQLQTKSKQTNLNQRLIEMTEEEGKTKFQKQDSTKSKFGTPKLLHVNLNVNDSNDELQANNLSLIKERNRRMVIDSFTKADNQFNKVVGVINSDLVHQLPPLYAQIAQSKSVLNPISDQHNSSNLQNQYTRKENDHQNTSNNSDKFITQKNTEDDKEIELQPQFQDTHHDYFDGYDYEDEKITNRQNKQNEENANHSFDKNNSLTISPSLSIKFIEKQKDYQKDSFEIRISYLPSSTTSGMQQPQQYQQSPVLTYEKRGRLTMRGYSTTFNSGLGYQSEFQQPSKTLYSNTNNSVIENDNVKKLMELDQTINEIAGQTTQPKRNSETENLFTYFQYINGNTDEFLNRIEERVLLECIQQVSTCGMNYSVDKITGIHTISFCILCELPISQTSQPVFQGKNRATSFTSNFSNSNTFGYNIQGQSTLNSLVFAQKDKFKSGIANQSTAANTIQHAQSSIQSFYPQSTYTNPQSSNLPIIYKTLSQKSSVNQLKNQLKQLYLNQNTTYKSSSSPLNIQRKRQASLPLVEKIHDYYDIKEDESLENNMNNSNEHIKQFSRKYNNRKNSNSMTSLEKSPIKSKFPQQSIIFERIQQVLASNTQINGEHKAPSSNITRQNSLPSGSYLPKSKLLSNKDRKATFFRDYVESDKQSDPSSLQSSNEHITNLHIESERKDETFAQPRASEYSMKRNFTDYN